MSEKEFAIDVFSPNSPLYKALIFDTLKEFKEAVGPYSAYYSTFKLNNYSEKMATLTVSAEPLSHLYVTAPEADLENAIEWVKKANPHLSLEPTFNTGYESMDKEVLKKHKTVGINFTITE